MKNFILLLFLPIFIAACGGGGGSYSVSAGASIVSGEAGVNMLSAPSVSGAANVVPVIVDSGPAGNSVNSLFTTVTVCQPGSTTQCQTIDHVLVDTGSTGLRILSSVLSSSMHLNLVQTGGGKPVLGCANFLDGTFAWGPVALADVRMGGEVAVSTAIQVVGSSTYNSLSRPCSTSGSAIKTASDLGANGILGVGLSKQDCGDPCDPLNGNNPQNGMYFACSNASCGSVVGTTLNTAQQLQQPVAALAADNNGLAVILNNTNAQGQASLSGTMVFGLGTQANNQFSSLSVLGTDGQGYITTQMANTGLGTALTLATSFLDTGSSGLFFDGSITQCHGANAGYYCPAPDITTTASLIGQLGTASKFVTFTIGNADTLLSSSNTALPTLGATVGDRTSFDWGLPFFFGRTVVLGIEGKSSNFGTGPYYAL